MNNQSKEIERRREDFQTLTKDIQNLAALVGARFVVDDEKLQTYRGADDCELRKFANLA
ncbi:hypothetical protein [Mesorhizobium sp. B1-1-9]|nr:hypothetical protein [Mesorhizobium sp. B1-1-9]